MDDAGEHGMGRIKEIVDIYRNYEWRTQVLVASVRHVTHVIEAARIDAHVVTIPFKGWSRCTSTRIQPSVWSSFWPTGRRAGYKRVLMT